MNRLLGSSRAGPLFWPLLRGRSAIFMLHRFAMPDLGVVGHDPVVLRSILEALRRSRVRMLSLEQVFDELARGAVVDRPTVAFTIDDGYLDQAEIGAPAFAAYDCPVTTFATSGFLDRTHWFWWDRIELVFDSTPRTELSVSIGETPVAYHWSDHRDRRRAQADFTARCKEVPDETKLEAIDRLAAAADVDLPREAPARYAPMSWSDLRRCERSGMSFGPHTVTHPVLSRASDDQAAFELRESWIRLRDEAGTPVPIFCYPNGRPQDFGARERSILASLGIRGAVTGVSGYADRVRFASGPDARFEVRRFAYAESLPEMLQIVNGVERLKQIVRRER